MAHDGKPEGNVSQAQVRVLTRMALAGGNLSLEDVSCQTAEALEEKGLVTQGAMDMVLTDKGRQVARQFGWTGKVVNPTLDSPPANPPAPLPIPESLPRVRSRPAAPKPPAKQAEPVRPFINMVEALEQAKAEITARFKRDMDAYDRVIEMYKREAVGRTRTDGKTTP